MNRRPNGAFVGWIVLVALAVFLRVEVQATAISFALVSRLAPFCTSCITYSGNSPNVSAAGGPYIAIVGLSGITASGSGCTNTVTYAGTTMTLIGRFANSGSTAFNELWYTAGVASGISTVAVSLVSGGSCVTPGAVYQNPWASIQVYSGYDPVTPVGTFTTATATGTTFTQAATTDRTNDWLIAMVEGWNGASPPTLSATGSTVRRTNGNATNNQGFEAGDLGPLVSAGSNNLTWSSTASTTFVATAVALHPAATAASVGCGANLLLLGVGCGH